MYTKGLFNYLTCSSHDILCPVAPCFAIVLENRYHLHVICNDLRNDFQLLDIHYFTCFPSFSLKPRKVGAPPLENCGPVISFPFISCFCCASWSTSAQRWISQGQWGNRCAEIRCLFHLVGTQIEWLDCEFQIIYKMNVVFACFCVCIRLYDVTWWNYQYQVLFFSRIFTAGVLVDSSGAAWLQP